jgi:hypothetical protein
MFLSASTILESFLRQDDDGFTHLWLLACTHRRPMSVVDLETVRSDIGSDDRLFAGRLGKLFSPFPHLARAARGVLYTRPTVRCVPRDVVSTMSSQPSTELVQARGCRFGCMMMGQMASSIWTWNSARAELTKR